MKKFNFLLILIITSICSIYSCGLTTNYYSLSNAEAAKTLQEKLIEVAGDMPVYRLMLSSTTELETNFEIAHLFYKEGNTYKTKTLHLTQGIITGDEPETNTAITRSFNNEAPKKLSELDFTDFNSKIEEAKKLIPNEYEYAAIDDYDYKLDGNKRDDIFTINVVKKGESSERSGRNIVTNYYAIDFETKNGKIVMDN